MPPQMPDQLRRRVLMFYFAAGINIVMAMWVMSVGGGQVSGGMLGAIVLIFLLFGWLNFYFAKRLKRQWEAQLREHMAGTAERVNE